MIDEAAKRRETFDEDASSPIVLADGQSWCLRKPTIELRTTFRNGKAAAAYPVPTLSRELDNLVAAIAEADDNNAVLIGAATLGAALLVPNYDLTDSELDTLFSGRPGDPDSWDWARSVMDVATARNRERSFGDG